MATLASLLHTTSSDHTVVAIAIAFECGVSATVDCFDIALLDLYFR